MDKARQKVNVITITRQVGSWGDYIGVKVAELLNYKYIDREVINRAMEQEGLSRTDIEEGRLRQEESLVQRVVHSLAKLPSVPSTPSQALRFTDYYSFEAPEAECKLLMQTGFSRAEAARHICALSFPKPSRKRGLDYLGLVRSLVIHFAEKGNVVLAGSGSQAILKERPGALHVLVVAPLKHRTEAIMEQEGVAQPIAERRVKENDETRSSYMRRFHHVNWLDCLLYDMTINTGKTPWNDAAEMILELFKRREGIVSNLI
jgi:hypothetical protein